MKLTITKLPPIGLPAMLGSVLLVLAGCSPAPERSAQRAPDPLALVLAPHSGQSEIDGQIRLFQDRVRQGFNRAAATERLGWLFVAKARASFDPGYYKLAEACASVLDRHSPGCAEGLLLRGHVLQNLHRFKEAEPLARELVRRRGLAFDHGLLGDVLLEQGRLNEAVGAYQSMIDLRPDLHSFARAAQVRWMKGDADGAIRLMRLATRASSPQDPEAAAWVYTRLAGFQFQQEQIAEARVACDAALQLHPDYPPALLLRGRMLLALEDAAKAIDPLERAAKLNPLPEYQWALAEALRAAGNQSAAIEVEARLAFDGAAADPRTFSLYLATHADRSQLALQLAREELRHREDIFTHDALAWALAAAGQVDEAREHMHRALAEGTQDARLFLHAAVIAAKAGHRDEALRWFQRASALETALLPSERKQLAEVAWRLNPPTTQSAVLILTKPGS